MRQTHVSGSYYRVKIRAWGSAGSGKIRSGRVGSGRVGSGRVGSDRIGSDRIGLGRVKSDQIRSVQIGSARMGRAGSGRVLLYEKSSCVHSKSRNEKTEQFLRTLYLTNILKKKHTENKWP